MLLLAASSVFENIAGAKRALVFGKPFEAARDGNGVVDDAEGVGQRLEFAGRQPRANVLRKTGADEHDRRRMGDAERRGLRF